MDQFFWTEDNKYPMACRAQYRAVGKAEGEEYLRWGACPCEEEPEEVWTSYWCLPPVMAALHDSGAACSPADASADTGRYRREEEMSRGRSKKKKSPVETFHGGTSKTWAVWRNTQRFHTIPMTSLDDWDYFHYTNI